MPTTSSAAERSLMPLLITSMAVIAPLLFILGLVVGNQLQGNATLTADSISSWLSAIATVAIAILTFILAKETWYLREAQIQQLQELKRENIRPNVEVALKSSPVGMNFINVEVANLGKGIARKTKFTFFGRDGKALSQSEDVVASKFKKLAIFNLGIESIGIGQSISSYLFSFIELGKELNGEIFKPFLSIHIDFEDVEGTQYHNEFAIDFAQYEGITELGGDAMHQISSEIKKLREYVGKVTGHSHGRLAVNVYSEENRAQEDAETRAWLEEQRRRSGDQSR
jgi:uncharacterized membrane protein YidH (DUF202 family)